MKIKDIVNRDIVNLTNCEHEPIHIPGSIQPHGFLIGVKDNDYIIDFCSENCFGYTGISHQYLLSKSFSEIFGEEMTEKLKTYITNISPLASSPLILNLESKQFFCSIHKSEHIYVIEAEPLNESDHLFFNTFDQTRQFIANVERTKTLQELCDCVAQDTRAITGYDRVMVYRFDEGYNGEVFAESVRPDLEPFYGLHYPHTDIPAQARELYLKNLLRLIVDVGYKPVPIFTIDNAENKNLNLSHSVLRSTSPIHVQYLQNMGVAATLTISLIHQNKLWGLIACHHYSPKNLSPSIRMAAQLQGHFLTSQIDVRQSNEEYEVSRKTNLALEKFLATTLDDNNQSFSAVINNNQILDVCNATGVCICVNDIIYTHGKTPRSEEIKIIIEKLATEHRNTSFYTSNLSLILNEAKAYCKSAAGIIYHSLSVSDNDCIIWFRGETITEVNWGGDPNKAIVKDENGLHPRKSFNLWKEVVKCKSKPWLKPELNAAANFSYTLQKHVAMLNLSVEEEKYRKLTEVLKENNEELENINWISTHDLQEPLRKIQIMASRIVGNTDTPIDAKTNDLVLRMNNSAGRMQTLLKDILSYTRIKHAANNFEPADLNAIVNDALQNCDDIIKEKNAVVHITGLPTINGIPFLLKQLFTNLIINSLKFSDESRKQVIKIYAEQKNDFWQISLSDTGIGFEPKFSEAIFQIFKRLHNQSQFQGSGVGLALCKKIMQTHHGSINAIGKPNEGATFNLLFPVN